MLIHLKDENFKEEIKKGIVLVDFYANWCGPCKMVAPIIEELSKENKNIKFIKVDVDEQEELAKEYGIMSIPTMIVFKDGKEINKSIGFAPKEEITSWLKVE